MLLKLLLLHIVVLVKCLAGDVLPPSCPSKVYCYGELLDTVQMSGIYPDSKTFVDMPMKKPENITLDSFNTFVSNYTDRKPPQADILAWVENNFDPVGSEFDAWVPTDFKDNPSFLKKIRDPQLQAFGKAVNGIWKQLGRKINTKVRDNAELYSMVYVDNPIIVPGGRFREFYYWDSYWVLQGLFKSEMFVTAKGMINNFVAMVKSFGFVPNGGRVYYSQRSQPPLLIPMAKTYFDNTKDKDFIASITDDLAVEFNFWVTTHSVNVNGHTLYKYGDRSSGPRPESYREDIATASQVANPADRDDLLRNIKAAAESGLDFSSKWFHNKDGTNIGDLTDLKTRSIVPVELNSFLCKNAEILAEFYGYKNDTAKQTKFTKIASDLKTAINEVFWNEKAGAWFDYDLINNKSRPYFVVTNLAPLWTESFDQKKRSHIADRVLKYISDQGLDSYEGGVPTTLYNTSEQWDFPNVWAPYQHILIEGLRNLHDKRADDIAQCWAQKWVAANYKDFNETGSMFEKYIATAIGGRGGGGEYSVQLGFGWSNGVILDLLNTYGSTLTAVTAPPNNESLLQTLLQALAKILGSVVEPVSGLLNGLLKK